MKDELRNAISSCFILNSSFRGLALLAFAALAFGPPPVLAGVTEAWVHRYNNIVNNSSDHAAKVVRDAAGDMIVTGKSQSDMLTIKYSGADGSVLWQRGSDGTANNDLSTTPTAMAVDGSGNVVVTGYSLNVNGRADYYTAKYAMADGALLWDKRYNGPADGDDIAYAVAVDGSGNIVVTGTSGNAANSDYYTAKYAAADGALLWEKRYNGPANSVDEARAVAVDGNGDVVVTGSSMNSSANWDCYTAKYAAADGALLWEKRYNGPANSDDYATALAVDGTGNVAVTGYSGGQGSLDLYSAKYAAADGGLLWEKRYNGPADSDDYATALAVDGSGNVVVTGYSHVTASGAYEYYTAKYAAADGALLWDKRYNGPADSDATQAYAVAIDGRGNVVVTGSTYNGTNFNWYTAEYAATDGALLWEKRHNGVPAHLIDWPLPVLYSQSVAVDSTGNVVITGTLSNDDGSNDDYYTVKYAAADGALLWDKRYNGGPVNYADLAKAVAVDGSGDVVVTGTSQKDFYEDCYTAKYAAVDGALLWENRYPAASRNIGPNSVMAMAVDGSGNVVVTGGAYTGASDSRENFYTAKYASRDGTLLWEKVYDGPAKLRDQARAVAIDASGDVVVTGQSASSFDQGRGDVHDFYTVKYAAVDGALLWEKRYNGPTDLDDVPDAISVDGKGNVIVSGVSARSGSLTFGFTYDAYTAKYAALDGALLWEKRGAGPAAVSPYGDKTWAVAVDSGGNVVVTGTLHDTNHTNAGHYTAYTAKYAAADGALLWEKRSNGPANNVAALVRAVAVDKSDNVVVTGSSSNGTNDDYYTAKYAAADGSLLWERRYNSPANLEDIAVALRVDGNGNVVITGKSASSTTEDRGDVHDFYTAEYAAADGALLWEKRYNGLANGDDFASGVALGPNGMVVVTGSSDGTLGSGTGYDYATIVYREPLPPVTLDLIPSGIHFRFTGIPGRRYTIERAPAVTGQWNTINTQTAPASGLLEYIDADPPSGAAFYKTREL